jgi:hypothetical protein
MKARHLAAMGAALAIAACTSGSDDSVGQLQVRLTDAPDPRIAEAHVWISEVYVIGGGDESGPRYTITDVAQHFDLLDLQGGVTALLGDELIPVGDYTQMRMIVDSARVVLAAPYTFSDGSTTEPLTVPSGSQSGIKVNFSGPVNVTPGQTVLVVDFDVSRSFNFQGPYDKPTGVHFKPVLHATVADVAASIAGTVTPASDNATVYAILNAGTADADTVQTALADATTGAYILDFLAPATYTVSVKGTTLDLSKTVTVGPAQDTTGVDFP